MILCLYVAWERDVPTWPTILKPVGYSFCSSSGSMALMISSYADMRTDTETIEAHCTYLR